MADGLTLHDKDSNWWGYQLGVSVTREGLDGVGGAMYLMGIVEVFPSFWGGTESASKSNCVLQYHGDIGQTSLAGLSTGAGGTHATQDR